MRIILCSLLFVSLSPLDLFGWWDVAHMLTAEIAMQQLSPQAAERVEEIVGYLGEDFPESSDPITAACFPDDLTPLGLAGFKVWHGVLTPYDPEHILNDVARGSIDTLISTNNLHLAIENSIATLSNPSASRWTHCFMLKFLIHTVGDIHQPLHCIQLYSPQFPYGDLAGHRFKLTGRYRSLHVLWDSILGLGSQRLERPLLPEDKAWIEEFANAIMTDYPAVDLPDVKHMDPLVWSDESYHLAIECAYSGIEPWDEPSEEYLSKGRDCALRQIALAGYRLGALLEELYGS